MAALNLLMIVVVWCVLAGVSVSEGYEFDQNNFDGCVVLTSSYGHNFYWKIIADKVRVGLVAKDVGWIGWGISPHGYMEPGSDIVTQWVSSEGACASGCVRDSYLQQYQTQPLEDSQQDAVLVAAEKINGETRIVWERKLTTGDANDIAIDPNKSLLFMHALGFSMDDPVWGNNVLGGQQYLYNQHIPTTNFVLAATLANASWECSATAKNTTGEYVNDRGTWRTTWRLFQEDDADMIEFTIQAQAKGWMALGINTEDSMIGGDIIWATIDSSGTPVVEDLFALERDTPPSDPIQNVVLVSGSQGNMVLLWALDNTGLGRRSSFDERDCPNFCKHSDKGLATIDFFSGFSSDTSISDDKRKAHGIIMSFAWGILAIAGAFVARYLKKSQNKWVACGYLWVHWHGALGLLIFALNLIAFILITVYVGDQDTEHFKGAHEIIGLVIFIWAFFQPILGIVAERLLKKYEDPDWPAWALGTLHSWAGKGFLLLCLLDIYLGLALYCVPTYAMVTYGVMLGVIIVLFAVFELLRWVAPWGGYLGGPGFTFKQSGQSGSDAKFTEYQNPASEVEMKNMGDVKPENKIPWMNLRSPKQPSSAIKSGLWIFMGMCAIAVLGLWIATAVGIGEKDILGDDSYTADCSIGYQF